MPESVVNIAKEHLGNGAVYTQKNDIDPALLVGVPRSLSRKESNIQHLAPYGKDVWHCYEFACLHDTGIPYVGTVKLVYSPESELLVESKSLKLYLHSFALVKMGCFDSDIQSACETRIAEDVSKIVGIDVEVDVSLPRIDRFSDPILNAKSARILEWSIGLDHANGNPATMSGSPIRPFEVYDTHSIDILQPHIKTLDEESNPKFEYGGLYCSNSFRSNCRVTHQPDWASIYINYKNSHKGVEEQSLLEYLTSFRNEYHFHEEACELVFDNLWQFLGKEGELMVACFYTRRGGIDINPVRYTASGAHGVLNPDFGDPGMRTDRGFRL